MVARKILSIVLMLVLTFSTTLSFPVNVSASTVCGSGSDIGSGLCRVYLTATASSTWTVPTDWTSSKNTIEAIGGGGGGGWDASGAGGGGEYRKFSNLATSSGAIINYIAGSGGAGGASCIKAASGTPTIFGTPTI